MSPDFTFEDLKKILDYLEGLGITTLYSAPFFQARKGSTHGYDVIDPFTLNKEIGKLEDFREIGGKLKEKKMTWLQDIVPNHMAYDGGNIWLQDIFELGPASRHYNFFDINWESRNKGKVMAPFLGDSLEEVLVKKELKIELKNKGFILAYYDNVYPLSINSYPYILSEVDAGWQDEFSKFNGEEEAWQDLKISFLRQVDNKKQLEEKLNAAIEKINGSREKMKELVDLQFFLPSHWQSTEKEIDYRRFFTINDLICLRMEDEDVFNTYHHFIKQLCDAGLIQGLRIDHVDGLFAPGKYLRLLRKLMGEDFYIIVEKILEAGEELPRDWPVQGTSGYEFLAQVNHLFTNSKNEKEFSEAYNHISPKVADYEALIYRKKLFILKERMGGELENLWALFVNSGLLAGEEFSEAGWKEAMSAFLAAFPVYRIYPESFPLDQDEKEIVTSAYSRAIEELPDKKDELQKIRNIFLGEADKDREKLLYFVQRCQQFSGPLAAKGVEDTSFYIYNRLVSHNEVGDSPENFGISIEEFHDKMLQKKKSFPLAVNATATHDTKRGEDARMRLNVLSEIPAEWFSKVEEWKGINKGVRKNPSVPGPNEEYFIYQTLLAGKPFGDEENFISRTCNYLQKVLREAKVHSNWAEPNEGYEQDVFNFVKDILGSRQFQNSFEPFQKKIAAWGALKSLGQTIIKITAPGIPDIYQGTELWDLSYVDPDNRRPVNYDLRKEYLSEFESYKTGGLKEKLDDFKKEFSNGKIKMFTTYKVLQERRRNTSLFREGNYTPLELTGTSAKNFIGFARSSGDKKVIIVVPVSVTNLFNPQDLTFNRKGAEELQLDLPEGYQQKWTNIFTGKETGAGASIHLNDMFEDFPVVLLKNY